MGETYNIRVDISLVNLLEEFRKKVEGEIKKKYNLDEVEIHGTFTSAVLASMLKGKPVYFKVKKRGKIKGVIEFDNSLLL